MDSHATTRQPLQQYQQQQQQHLQQLKRPAPQPPLTNNNKKSTTGAAASGDASAAAAADDLHAWSLFRQNLNANFSESALAINGGGGSGNHHHQNNLQNNHQNHNHHYRSSSPNDPLPNGYHQNQNRSSTNNGGPQTNSASNFQLRESTVNNILSHPKYGAQLKNQDAFTYLRFGLPRVKVTSSLNSTANNNKAAQPDPPIIDHQPTRRNFGGNNNNIGNNNNSQNNHHQQQKSLNESSYQSSRQQPPLPPPPQTQQQLNEELKRRFWSSESNLRAAGAGASGDHRSSDFDSSGQYSDSSGREMLPGGPRGGGGVPRSSGVPANHHGRSPGNRGPKTTTQPTTNQRSQRDPMKPSYSINDLRYSGVNNKNHHNRGDFNADYDGGRPSSGDGSSSVDHHEPPPPAHHPHQRPRSRASPHFDHPLNRGGGGRGVYPDDDIRLDEMMVNGATGNGGGGGPFHSSSHSLPPPMAKHPHLVVKDLLYEVDKSPVWRRLCGFSRQKLRVLEDVSFDVRGGELMAIMATSGKSFDC